MLNLLKLIEFNQSFHLTQEICFGMQTKVHCTCRKISSARKNMPKSREILEFFIKPKKPGSFISIANYRIRLPFQVFIGINLSDIGDIIEANRYIANAENMSIVVSIQGEFSIRWQKLNSAEIHF